MNPPAIPLALIPSGQTVELVEIQGGRGIRSRLEQLGFFHGVQLHVEKNNQRHGPIVVGARGSSYCLGRGESMQVMVR